MFPALHVVSLQVNMSVSGMSCASCSSKIQSHLNSLPYVERAVVNLLAEKAVVTFKEEETVDLDAVKAKAATAVEELGFGCKLLEQVVRVWGLGYRVQVFRFGRWVRLTRPVAVTIVAPAKMLTCRVCSCCHKTQDTLDPALESHIFLGVLGLILRWVLLLAALRLSPVGAGNDTFPAEAETSQTRGSHSQP